MRIWQRIGQSHRSMVHRAQLALNEAVEWLGDWHPLAEQLGCADGLAALGDMTAELRSAPVHNLASLRRFLRDYQTQILVPLELPTIQRAHGHATRHEVRELVALDQHLARDSAMQPFLSASRRVGRSQLQKLRPLRDERVVQRYLRAVQGGEAYGWHTLVYGLTLAVYSLPLRQGLLGYAHHTMRGFIYAATRTLRLSAGQHSGLFEGLCADLPHAVDTVLGRAAAA
jgi:urease accessory protein UreF